MHLTGRTGPFNTFKLPENKECDWTGLKFSPDGKSILTSTNGAVIHLIDAFQAVPQQSLTGHTSNKAVPLDASFSPDSQFVFSGSTDGRVHVWSTAEGVEGGGGGGGVCGRRCSTVTTRTPSIACSSTPST
ncbi:hypothetical protein HPB47_025594 [Ixodes persulcatus]|uniref:Uncharacterized protein n=1 Tax=Ixodes persulcatus TaxID=34615 RepID=A0AC60Q121_IXOPE|nr:hypothetical protein HPB47_025594 [Ixodes persulcatus]